MENQGIELPLVAADFMNRDHQQAAEMLRQLQQLTTLAASNENNQRISLLFDSFIAHHREHFAHEQAEMEFHKFPAYPVHKGEHERVLNELETQYETWLKQHDHAGLSYYLNKVYIPWLQNHIETMDTVTASYITQSVGQ